MTFSDFLKNRQKNLGLETAKEHFELLSGKKSKFDIRLFQAITSGNRFPTTDFLAWIFSNIEDYEKKSCIISFFNSKIKSNDKQMEFLIEYLLNNIDDTFSLKESPNEERCSHTLNPIQVEFLSHNTEALLLWNKLTLFNKVPILNSITKETIQNFIKYNLATLKNNNLICPDANYIYPINSNPMTIKNIEFIFLKNIEFFFSLTNKDLQIQTMRFAIIDKNLFEYIKNKMKSLNDLITKNTFKSNSPSNEHKTIFLASFLRELKDNEI